MLTKEKLNEFGANTESGIKRCANNEALYLRLVGTIPSNNSFNNLYEAIKRNDLAEAFSNAHGLKGILANLSLDSLLAPVTIITEHLRNKDMIDYSTMINNNKKKRKELEALL